jgi:hypothetical protein
MPTCIPGCKQERSTLSRSTNVSSRDSAMATGPALKTEYGAEYVSTVAARVYSATTNEKSGPASPLVGTGNKRIT